MERYLCLNCNVLEPLGVHGECSKCGSLSVVSEHAHGFQKDEMWPGYAEWAADAVRTYRELKAEVN